MLCSVGALGGDALCAALRGVPGKTRSVQSGDVHAGSIIGCL